MNKALANNTSPETPHPDETPQATETHPHGASERFVHFFDWLDEKLLPVFGPPPLGPYETVVKQIGEAMCPVCGSPVAEHFIDRTTDNAVLNCPTGHLPLVEHNEPLNEFGMPRVSH